jgi:hypothetical protein
MKIDISKIFDSCIGGFSFRFLAHTGSFCGGRTGSSLLFPGYEHVKSMICSLINPSYMLALSVGEMLLPLIHRLKMYLHRYILYIIKNINMHYVYMYDEYRKLRIRGNTHASN